MKEKQKLELVLRVEDNQLVSNAKEFVETSRKLLQSKYNYFVQETNYVQAKDDRATINKFVENIKRKRIDTEREFLEIYQPTKDMLMELEKEAESLAQALGEGIKDLDNFAKEEKKQRITAFYEDIKVDGVEFDKIFNEKWLNKSVSDKAWQDELTNKVDRIKRDIDYITSQKMEDEYVFLSSYLQCFDIPTAKNQYDTYMSSKIKAEGILKSKVKHVCENSVKGFDTEIITTVVQLEGSKEELDALLIHINQNTSIKVRPYKEVK